MSYRSSSSFGCPACRLAQQKGGETRKKKKNKIRGEVPGVGEKNKKKRKRQQSCTAFLYTQSQPTTTDKFAVTYHLYRVVMGMLASHTRCAEAQLSCS
jgi:hypothetical protein